MFLGSPHPVVTKMFVYRDWATFGFIKMQAGVEVGLEAFQTSADTYSSPITSMGMAMGVMSQRDASARWHVTRKASPRSADCDQHARNPLSSCRHP